LCLLAATVYADSATVAVASNFSQAAKALVADFETRHPGHIRLVLGSSAKLFAQIHQGAPFDILLSADEEKPQALIDQGLAQATSYLVYAEGSLVVWSTDADLLSRGGEALLRSGTFARLALANSRLAPYGLAAQQTLQALNHYESLKPKLVMGESVGQTFQFVVTGNATLGFVAASQLRSWQEQAGKQGSSWAVPTTLHQPILQAGVLLNRASHNRAAQAFMKYLHSPEAKKIIQNQGYRLP
jgi:molybdate transport system substrate-binding protein